MRNSTLKQVIGVILILAVTLVLVSALVNGKRIHDWLNHSITELRIWHLLLMLMFVSFCFSGRRGRK